MRARFGEFIVDFETRQLLRDAHPVHLTPKAYQLLVLLVEAQPRALSKDELQQGLWPSTFVDEANLSVVVAELRSALGDDARQPRYVRTVHGFGYAFAATVARDQPTPPPGSSLRGGAWWLHSESTHAKLQEGENAVGRELPTDVWLDSGSVSRRHAKIVVDGMKLSPPRPSMVDARDAILLADRVDFAGASQTQLWGAFAKRGLGVVAHSADANSAAGSSVRGTRQAGRSWPAVKLAGPA